MEQGFPNLRHLRVCLMVAKTNSLSVASKRVHLSQPAISQALSKLEKGLGIPLFVRQSNGLFPTDQGLLYLQRVERALAYLEQGASLATRAQAKKNGVSRERFDHFLTSAQLRALVAISRSNNFTLAARNIDISQPSLHRAARDLEKLSNMELFKAGKHGVELSPGAKILARYAMLASSELRHARNEIQDALGLETTTILIGTLPLARSHILPTSIDRLICEDDKVQVQIIDGPYGEQLGRLRQGEIDFLIGALRDQTPADDVVQETLFVDRLAITVGSDHPLAQISGISISDLLEFPWIAPPKITPTGHYLFQKLGIGDMSTSPVRVVSSSLELVRSLLLTGNYITIISSHQISRDIEEGTLVQLPVDLRDSGREIGLSYRHDWHPTALQQRLLDIIRSVSMAG